MIDLYIEYNNVPHDSIESKNIEDAFWFGLKELMPRKRNLEVTIVVSKLKNDSAQAYQCSIDKGEHEIEINNGMEYEDLITAVWHELVHVRQFERDQFQNEDHIPYFKKPSEIEAYKLQEELLEKWNAKTRMN